MTISVSPDERCSQIPDAAKVQRRIFQQFIKIQKDHRTDTPDRSVNILAAMFIEASSWNKSLAA